MADFNISFEYLMDDEDFTRSGVITDDGKGSIAKYGINSAANPEIDVRNLTLEGAKQVFYNKYWLKYNIDKLKSQRLATKLFDAGVNIYTPRVIKALQSSLNLKTDGLLGPISLKVLNYSNVENNLNTIVNFSIRYYTARSQVIKNYPLEQLLARGRKLP